MEPSRILLQWVLGSSAVGRSDSHNMQCLYRLTVRFDRLAPATLPVGTACSKLCYASERSAVPAITRIIPTTLRAVTVMPDKRRDNTYATITFTENTALT